MRILLISPHHAEGAWLHKALHESAHSLQRADDLRDGVFVAGEEPFDAVIVVALDGARLTALHAVLPGLVEVARGAAIVTVLGVEASARERSRLLRAGADACFRHPFSFIEMHERLLALSRTATKPPAPVASATPLPHDALSAQAAKAAPRLDAATREIVEGERRAGLTRREYLLIECLLREACRPVPREQVIRYAWPEKDDIDASTVNLVVSRLRRKLDGAGIDARIETISRYGYQLSLGA
ncbi:response regulator transcription factor [Paraburkholderia acidisoli]|uniref:DNA-binding response regulator n=1 Tax=Paraburkholderia acidisoli TaxID=2571748 RepID=A0A7Z2GQN1_9BURK|nr:response regulator transcription factor [Paraburkholderia acidisoli]QGZ65909.1 DNA-binding response regulator [Paraburkholderia acidisoli]